MKDVSEMTRAHTFYWGGNSADERGFAGRFISSVHLALQRGLRFLVQTHGHVWKRLVFIFLVGVDQRHILAAPWKADDATIRDCDDHLAVLVARWAAGHCQPRWCMYLQ